jgi:hypothetical protein
MTKFKNPAIGTKIAEYRISTLKRLYWIIMSPFKWIIDRYPVFIIAFFTGIIWREVETDWIKWIIVIPLSIFILFFVFIDLYAGVVSNTHEIYKGKTFRLFLVENGLEIENYFISYNQYLISKETKYINGFKLDGDTLFIQTNGGKKIHFLKSMAS